MRVNGLHHHLTNQRKARLCFRSRLLLSFTRPRNLVDRTGSITRTCQICLGPRLPVVPSSRCYHMHHFRNGWLVGEGRRQGRTKYPKDCSQLFYQIFETTVTAQRKQQPSALSYGVLCCFVVSTTQPGTWWVACRRQTNCARP